MAQPKQFVYHIEIYEPCDGCDLCEDACFYNGGKLIQEKTILTSIAIGQLPDFDGKLAKTTDHWPMIIPELCVACGECAKVCPEKAITKTDYHESHLHGIFPIITGPKNFER